VAAALSRRAGLPPSEKLPHLVGTAQRRSQVQVHLVRLRRLHEQILLGLDAPRLCPVIVRARFLGRLVHGCLEFSRRAVQVPALPALKQGAPQIIVRLRARLAQPLDRLPKGLNGLIPVTERSVGNAPVHIVLRRCAILRLAQILKERRYLSNRFQKDTMVNLVVNPLLQYRVAEHPLVEVVAHDKGLKPLQLM
jgi:hypothetical protein